MTLFRTTSLAGIAMLLAGATSAAELTMINCGAGSSPGDAAQAKSIAEWEAATGNSVTVEFVPWGQCQQKATTLAAAGNPPAISLFGSRTLKQLAANDLIIPFNLTDEELDTFPAPVIATTQFDGKTWGIPRAFSTKGLYWNRDLFAEAGLDLPNGPQSFEDVLTAAKAISENTEASGFGMVAKSMDNTMHQFLNFAFSNGGEILSADGEVVFNTPENVATLEFYSELAKYAQPGPTAYTRGEVRPLFAEGQVGMMITGGWGRRYFEDVNYGVNLIPAGPSGSHSTILITDSLAVFKGTGVEVEAADLVKFLTSPELQSQQDEINQATPIRLDARTEALKENDPTWGPFLDGIPLGKPEPLMVDYLAMQDVIIEGVQGVILGEISAADAVNDIQEGLTDLQ